MESKKMELTKRLIKQTINKIISEGKINLEDNEKTKSSLKEEVKRRILSIYQSNVSEKIVEEMHGIEENFDLAFDDLFYEMNQNRTNTEASTNIKMNTIQQKADFYNKAMEKSSNKEIKFTPIYKGEWGKIAPERKHESREER